MSVGRRRTHDLEQLGAQHLQSLQSSVLAMQQTMSQQASQLGGLQHMLEQQQRESQAWAQEVQDARARLRSMQQDHAREISALRGTHSVRRPAQADCSLKNRPARTPHWCYSAPCSPSRIGVCGHRGSGSRRCALLTHRGSVCEESPSTPLPIADTHTHKLTQLALIPKGKKAEM